MARGWESKSIQLQQEEAPEREIKGSVRLTPEQIGREKERQGLWLSRTRLLQQMEVAQSPRYQQMLKNAMAEIDARLAKLTG